MAAQLTYWQLMSDATLSKFYCALPDPKDSGSLQTLGTLAEKHATDALNYYVAGIPARKRVAQRLRLGALVLGSLAAVAPLLTTLALDLSSTASIQLYRLSSTIPAVLAVTAAACIGADKVLGASSAWMRHMTARLEIEAELSNFRVTWAKECLRGGAQPTIKQVIASLDVLQTFVTKVNDIVRSETRSWVLEFREVLANTEKSAESASAQALALAQLEHGAIQVTVPNTGEVDGDRWELFLDGHARGIKSGRIGALTDVAAGIHRICVQAKQHERDVVFESTVVVEPGRVAALEVSFS